MFKNYFNIEELKKIKSKIFITFKTIKSYTCMNYIQIKI